MTKFPVPGPALAGLAASAWLILAGLTPLANAEPGDERAGSNANQERAADPDGPAATDADAATDATELTAADAELIQAELAEFVQQHRRRGGPGAGPDLDQDDQVLEQLEALHVAEDHRAYIQLALRYLTESTPSPEFAGVLAALTKATEQAEGSGRPILRQPLLPKLLELGLHLPVGNMHRYEIGFAAAMHARRAEDFSRQEEILREFLAEDDIPAKAAPALKLALGEALESQRRYNDAVEIYGQLTADGEDAPREADGLLRGLLILLQLDQREQAAELAERLAALPESVIAGAEANWQIEDLRKAAAIEGGLAAHWERSDRWWPQWQQLRARVGVEPEADHIVIPYLGQIDRVQQALIMTAREGRQKEYFHILDILAHAARWLPSGVSEWSTAVSPNGVRLAPNHSENLQQLLIAMNEALEPVTQQQRRQRQLMLALAYIDQGDGEKALEQVEAFGSEPQPNDAVSQAIRRLWGLILLTLDRDLDAPIRQLQQALDGDEREFDRAATVATLADLLNASGRRDDEARLLREELENPEVRQNPAAYQRLQQRFTLLTQQGMAIDLFHQAVRDWTDARNLDWFEQADPQSLDDPRLSDLEAVLAQPENLFSTPEIFKLHILVASDPEMPLPVQLETFSRAVDLLYNEMHSRAEAHRLVLDVVEDDRYPERLRSFVLARALAAAASRFDPHAISYLELPESGLFDENQLATAEIIAEFITPDPYDGDALYAIFDQRAGRPLDRASVSITVEIATQLARIGRADLLAKMAERSDDFNFTVETEPFRAELILNIARLRRAAEELDALNQPLSELVLQHLDPDTIEKPEVLDDLRDVHELDHLDRDDALAVKLYLVKEGRVGLGGTEFWHDLIRHANFNNADPELALKLTAGLLEHETDDVRRSITVLYSPEFIDIDDPEDRDALFEVLEPWKQRDDAPRTREILRITRAQVDERLGETIDWHAVFSGVNHPVGNELKTRLLLRAGLSEDDRDGLRRVLNSMESSLMFEDTMLPLTLPAMDAAGLDAELDAARSAAGRATHRLFQESWLSADVIDALRALRLTETLGDKADGVPEGWLESVAPRVGSTFRRHILIATARRIQEQWQEALEAINDAIDMVPTYYALYWDRARILAALDRPEEAIEDLDLFLKYCKDEVDYRDAKQLRDDLANGKAEAEDEAKADQPDEADDADQSDKSDESDPADPGDAPADTAAATLIG